MEAAVAKGEIFALENICYGRSLFFFFFKFIGNPTKTCLVPGIVDARNLIDEKMEQEEEKMRAAVAKGETSSLCFFHSNAKCN